MLDIKKHYAVLYCSGMYGTWLTWFINQHEGFPKYNINKVYVKGKHTDYCCNGATWVFSEDTEDGCKDDVQTWNDYIQKGMYNRLEGPTAESAHLNALKILPDHDFTWKQHYNDETMCKHVFQNIHGIVLPYLPMESPFLENFKARNEFLWDFHLDQDEGWDFWHEAAQHTYNHVRNSRGYYSKLEMYSSLHRVNLHDLFMCNEQEYHRLVSFCDTVPLDDWEHVIHDYRTRIVNVDWRKFQKEWEESQEKE